jgi:hypothetical protein
MNKHLYLHLATAVLVTVLGVNAQAQSRTSQQLRVSVPFAFNVGNSSLPAGEYKLRIVNPSSDHSVLALTEMNGGPAVMVRTTDIIGWSTAKAKLTFRHYGDTYFLAQVWMASDSTGLETPSSRAEQTLRRQTGKSGKIVELVAVNGR